MRGAFFEIGVYDGVVAIAFLPLVPLSLVTAFTVLYAIAEKLR